MPFETQCRPIPTIIAQEGNRIVFRLPKNQRKYGWGEKTSRILWDDIMDFAEIDKGQYYCGNIITSKVRINEGVFETVTHQDDVVGDIKYIKVMLVDGQQRLTTLTLLAAALRDVSAELRAEYANLGDDQDDDEEEIESLNYQQILRHIAANYIENHIIARMVILEDDIDKTVLKAGPRIEPDRIKLDDYTFFLELTGRPQDSLRLQWIQLTTAQRENYQFDGYGLNARPHPGRVNIYRNYDQFKRLIARKILDNCMNGENDPHQSLLFLKTQFFTRLMITETRVDDVGEAYRIFGTINDRGIKLLETDKLRNSIMGAVDLYTQEMQENARTSIIKQIEQYWGILWELDKSADSVLADFWNGQRKIAQEEDDEDDEEEVADEEPGDEEEAVEEAVEEEADGDGEDDGDANEGPSLVSPITKANLHESIWKNLRTTHAADYTGYSNFARDFSRVATLNRYRLDTCLVHQNMRYIGSKSHIPLSLSLLYRTEYMNEDDDEFKEFDKISEEHLQTVSDIVLSFSLAIWLPFSFTTEFNNQKVANVFQRWARLVRNLNDPEEIIQEMRDDCQWFIQSLNINRESFLEKFSSHTWNDGNDRPKTLLYALDREIQRGNHAYEMLGRNAIELEHILPQSIIDGDDVNVTWWREHIDIEEVGNLDALVYSIGNLTLLTKGHNRLLSNKKFRRDENDPELGEDYTEVADGEGFMEDVVQGEVTRRYSHKRAALRDSNIALNQEITGDGMSHILPYIENDELAEGYQLDQWTDIEIQARTKALGEVTWNMVQRCLGLE